MIHVTGIQRIWVAQHRIDFRRQHDGLLAEAFKLGLDPFRGDVVLFIGQGKSRIKILYADTTGLWLSIKRFTMEAMKTQFRFLRDPHCNYHEIELPEIIKEKGSMKTEITALSPAEFEELSLWMKSQNMEISTRVKSLIIRLCSSYEALLLNQKNSSQLLKSLRIAMGIIPSSEKGSQLSPH